MPTFVSPILLTGGLLIGIPILLHLVMRQRPRHLEFPALRFLQSRRETNRRRLRLRHLLLLLLRCAAVLLFALALARPVFVSSGLLGGGRAPVAAALLFDTRPRMDYRHRNQTRLEQAQQTARQLLKQLPPDSQFVVLDAGRPRTRFDVDRGAAAQRITQLDITYADTALAEMIDGALTVLRESELDRKEVFLFTDVAARDWQSPDAERAMLRRLEENPEVGFYIIDVGVTQPSNFSLGALRLSREVVSDNTVVRIATDVFHLGDGGARTVQLLLPNDDGTLEKRGEVTVACDQTTAAPIVFRTTFERPGTHQGVVRLVRPDSLTVDDVRYFSLRVQPPWQVLVVAPAPIERTSRMLTEALAPRTLRQRGDAPYECEVIEPDAIVQENLSAYDAIWLLDPPPLSSEAWNRLGDYVTAGGGLAMALGGKAGPVGDSFNATASMELLPGELKRPWSGLDVYLAPDRLEHPVLREFKRREGAIPWDRNPLFRLWELGPLAEGVEVVVATNDRRPVLLARHVGQGRVLTLTTPLTQTGRTPWNQILAPQQDAWPGFVLVHGMTEYLVGSTGQRLNYEVGEAAGIALDQDKGTYASYLLTTPQGTHRVKPTGDSTRLSVTGTLAPGQYRVAAGGKQGVAYGFSVNVPPDATRLERADETVLQETFPQDRMPIVRTLDQLRRSRKETAAQTEWEAYPWLMLLLVGAMIAEGLLSSLFYKKRKRAITN